MKLPENLPPENILDGIADGVFTVDTDWNITYFNDAASRITGVPKEEAVGGKCWDVFHSSLCDGDCALRACMDQGGTLSNKSIYIIRPDGVKTPVSISAAPLYDEEGRLLGGVETFRDMTAIHLMRKKMEGAYTVEDIVSRSEALTRIFSILPRIAASPSTVLLLGESGTGKELFARAIHNLGERRSGPFVPVNCGALPDNLLESELFGYKAGAFTDARRDKPGKFELAEGGTIFLDEIGEMPAHLQVKLLRVLQEKVVEPLGGVEPVKVDARVVAASNRDLEAMAAEGAFRGDLYYRLNVAAIKLPPLRERPEDIPILASHFIERFNHLQDKDVQGFSEDVLALLMRHSFPGNVRELENIIEYAFILCHGGLIQLEHLPERMQPEAGTSPDKPRTMDEIKRRAAKDAVRRHGGRKMAACRELGISKDTLRRLLQQAERA